jgi:hypothetical protein
MAGDRIPKNTHYLPPFPRWRPDDVPAWHAEVDAWEAEIDRLHLVPGWRAWYDAMHRPAVPPPIPVRAPEAAPEADDLLLAEVRTLREQVRRLQTNLPAMIQEQIDRTIDAEIPDLVQHIMMHQPKEGQRNGKQ